MSWGVVAWSITDAVSCTTLSGRASEDLCCSESAALWGSHHKGLLVREQSRRGTLEITVAGREERGVASRRRYIQVSLDMISLAINPNIPGNGPHVMRRWTKFEI